MADVDLETLTAYLEQRIAARRPDWATVTLGPVSADAILAALKRIPELERSLDEATDQNMRQAQRLERAERAVRPTTFVRTSSEVERDLREAGEGDRG